MVLLQKIFGRCKHLFRQNLTFSGYISPHRTCTALKQPSIASEFNGPNLDLSLKEIRRVNSETLRITFSNHATCDFKNIWLRDSCQCEFCIHPATKQKLVNIRDLDIGVQPLSISLNDSSLQSALRIDWAEQDVEDTHCSIYPATWLYQFSQAFSVDGCREVLVSSEYSSCLPPQIFWDKNVIESTDVEIPYKNFMRDEESLFAALAHINAYGIAVIKGVPLELNHVLKVARRISFVKQTTYGRTFQVINNPDPKAHLSYTGRRFELHTDLSYMQNAPSIQLLHCLEAAHPDYVGIDAGGISFFADAYHAATWLKKYHPHFFHILSNTKLLFTFQDAERGRWFRMERPLIEVNRHGEIIEMYWSDFSMRPPLIPVDEIVPFYQAYRCISDKLNEDSSLWKFFLTPGDLLIFNNKRVLHGRDEYDATKVKRHLEGCYIDLQEAMSLYESLLEKQNMSKGTGSKQIC